MLLEWISAKKEEIMQSVQSPNIQKVSALFHSFDKNHTGLFDDGSPFFANTNLQIYACNKDYKQNVFQR